MRAAPDDLEVLGAQKGGILHPVRTDGHGTTALSGVADARDGCCPVSFGGSIRSPGRHRLAEAVCAVGGLLYQDVGGSSAAEAQALGGGFCGDDRSMRQGLPGTQPGHLELFRAERRRIAVLGLRDGEVATRTGAVAGSRRFPRGIAARDRMPGSFRIRLTVAVGAE